MSRPRLLDFFCGAGGCSVGYHRAGFDVVGVDIKPQPRYPFPFIQSGAVQAMQAFLRCGGMQDSSGRVWLLSNFDAVHASPPCQAFSVSTAPHGKTGRAKHKNLVEPIRKLFKRSGKPWVIENVMGAPMEIPSIVLCGRMFGLRVLRHRIFESSFLMLAPSHPKHPGGMLTNSHRSYDRGESPYVCLAGHNFERREGEKAMGIDWMGSRRELAQAIPPAYTEFVGRQLIEAVARSGGEGEGES